MRKFMIVENDPKRFPLPFISNTTFPDRFWEYDTNRGIPKKEHDAGLIVLLAVRAYMRAREQMLSGSGSQEDVRRYMETRQFFSQRNLQYLGFNLDAVWLLRELDKEDPAEFIKWTPAWRRHKNIYLLEALFSYYNKGRWIPI